MLNRRTILQLMGTASIAAASGVAPATAANKLRVAMVVKSLGNNGFFDACRDGGEEAAKELGNVELIYTGPTKTDPAEDQIAVVDSLIAQKVNAIAISANDASALAPACKKAMEKGITVISFDFGRRPGRAYHAARPVECRARRLQMCADDGQDSA